MVEVLDCNYCDFLWRAGYDTQLPASSEKKNHLDATSDDYKRQTDVPAAVDGA